jgi:hypothetical protein
MHDEQKNAAHKRILGVGANVHQNLLKMAVDGM